MTIWSNQKLIVYHGTDDQASLSTIQLNLCKPFTDFGRGFYVTTHQHQAEQWANERVRRMSSAGVVRSAMVQIFAIDRDKLGRLDTLAFARATQDFWSFVTACRTSSHGAPSGGSADHGRDPLLPDNQGKSIYDVVLGLVTLWPQRLIISDCDQWSFHTSEALKLLTTSGQRLPPTGNRYF